MITSDPTQNHSYISLGTDIRLNQLPCPGVIMKPRQFEYLTPVIYSSCVLPKFPRHRAFHKQMLLSSTNFTVSNLFNVPPMQNISSWWKLMQCSPQEDLNLRGSCYLPYVLPMPMVEIDTLIYCILMLYLISECFSVNL